MIINVDNVDNVNGGGDSDDKVEGHTIDQFEDHVENASFENFDSDDEVGSSVKITTLAFVKMAKMTMFVK